MDIKKHTVHIGETSFAVLKIAAETGLLILEELLTRRKGIKNNINSELQTIHSLKAMSVRSIISRLKQKGLIQKDSGGYTITKSGNDYLKSREDIQRKWDGKWRMVFFDIPEKLAYYRRWIRSYFVRMNYKPLQKSVLIGKLPPEEDFFQEVLDKNLYRYVRIITVGEVDDETILEM